MFQSHSISLFSAPRRVCNTLDSIVRYLIDCLLCPCIYHIVYMYTSVRSSHDCYLIRGVCLCVSAAYPAAYGQISQAFPHPPPIIPQQQREGNAHARHAPEILIHAGGVIWNVASQFLRKVQIFSSVLGCFCLPDTKQLFYYWCFLVR